jgi:Protein of unknown function (DUF2490)
MLKWLIAGFVASFATQAIAQGPEPDGELWTSVWVTGPVVGPLLADGEIQLRFGDKGTRRSTVQARAALGTALSKKVTVYFGYLRAQQYPRGQNPVRENRLYQQLNWSIGKVGPGTLSARTRLEQRMFETRNVTGWRARQQLRYAAPVGRTGKTAVVLTTEAFVALNTTDWGARAGLDQWRNFAGINVALGKGLTIEAGYLNRYTRRSGARDRMDHIVPVTLVWRW